VIELHWVVVTAVSGAVSSSIAVCFAAAYMYRARAARAGGWERKASASATAWLMSVAGVTAIALWAVSGYLYHGWATQSAEKPTGPQPTVWAAEGSDDAIRAGR
jgi:lysylphosphatidylglycerol synthetase-like protein (DUF2156 family)